MLATVQIPEGDGPVVTATGQSGAIGAHLERLHRSLMRLLIPVPQTGFPHALPARYLPPAQHAITASTDQQLPTGSPGQRRDHPRMPRKSMHALPTVGMPHEELPALSLPQATATEASRIPSGPQATLVTAP